MDRPEIYIIDALRTPIGGAFKSLSTFSAAQLAAFVMTELLSRNKIKPGWIDQVVLGNTVSAGAGQNLARQAAFLSSLPVSVPAFTVNSVCGSGLQSVISSAQAIFSGDADLVIAGGTESASQCPFLVKKNDKEKKDDNVFVDSLIQDGLWCNLSNRHMGELAEFLAEKFRISREEQDSYALNSHRKTCLAQQAGKLKAEIVPVKIRENQFLTQDEKPRSSLDLERLKNIPAAFKKGGTVTAGNSSIPSDGAAVVLLASKRAVKNYGLKPKAHLLGYSSIAIEPEMVFTAAIESVKTCLRKSRLTMREIAFFEISEAFAVQAIVTQRGLKIPDERMNIYGGDVALGHPLGTAGARIFVTLISALRNEKKKAGIASVCLGGGGAVAIAVKAAR